MRLDAEQPAWLGVSAESTGALVEVLQMRLGAGSDKLSGCLADSICRRSATPLMFQSQK